MTTKQVTRSGCEMCDGESGQRAHWNGAFHQCAPCAQFETDHYELAGEDPLFGGLSQRTAARWYRRTLAEITTTPKESK